MHFFISTSKSVLPESVEIVANLPEVVVLQVLQVCRSELRLHDVILSGLASARPRWDGNFEKNKDYKRKNQSPLGKCLKMQKQSTHCLMMWLHDGGVGMMG